MSSTCPHAPVAYLLAHLSFGTETYIIPPISHTILSLLTPQSGSSLSFGLVLRRLHWLVLGREVQADTVDAVPLVGRSGEPLTLKDVSEMTTAVGANNLSACHAKCAVLVPSHSSGDAVEVGRPAAS